MQFMLWLNPIRQQSLLKKRSYIESTADSDNPDDCLIHKRFDIQKKHAASVARTQYLQISGLKYFSLTLSQMS